MMDASQVYIIASLIILAVIAILFVVTGRMKGDMQPSRLAMLALFLIIAGIVFGENRCIGYGLLGAGVVLAIIDILRRMKGG